MFFDWGLNLSNLDIIVIIIISFLTSVLVILGYCLIKNNKKLYIDFLNTNNIFFGKGKNGYLEKLKTISDKTTYIECNFILSIYNNTNRPYTFRNIHIVSRRRGKVTVLEEGSLNVNGTGKSIAGVTTYDKLKHLVIKPYEAIDYDVNIRLSKQEYWDRRYIYLAYRGKKNKNEYIKIKFNKVRNKTTDQSF